MKYIFFITIYLFYFSFNSMAENFATKSGKYFTNTLEGIVPLKLIKEVGKKITKFGGKDILFGATAAGILSKGLADNDNTGYNSEEIIATNNLIKVYAKGQINLDNIDESVAKRRALEDALYFASMKAGAEVTGFSSIDEKTSLNENFLVQPNNKILDYKILKSYKEDQNYIVEVEAVVGNLNNFDSVCSKRKTLNINEFKGNYIINTNTPSWAYSYIDKVLYQVRRHMLNNKSINYTNYSRKKYDFNFDNFDKSFDYKTLVNGSEVLNNGDFIYIPSFSLNKSKVFPKFYLAKNNEASKNPENKHLIDKDVLSFNSKIEIYNAVTNTFVTSVEKKYFIPTNIDSNFEMIELFSKKDQSFIDSKLNNISKDIYDTISSKLFCEPIVAEIKIINNQLEVPLGQKQGLRVNQLAVLEDNAANSVMMLSISKLGNNRATLSPLNSNLKIDSFLGKEARFLE